MLAAVLVWSPWSGSDGSSAGAHGDGASADASGGSSTTGAGGGAAGSDDSGPDGVEGGTVRLGLAGPVVVDPPFASAASPSDLMVLDLLYDGLTRRSATGAIEPGIALTWTPDSAQQVWRFGLDPDARFTSGRSIVAADVVASLQHVMAAGDGSPAALRLEAVQGFRAYVDGTVPAVSGLRAIDDRTVEIALDTPLAQLPELLAAPPYGVVDVPGLAALAADPSAAPGSVAATQLRTLDLTGSWLVADAGESRLRLERRPGAAGHLDAIELHPFADGATAFEAFEQEKVDWAPVPGDRFGEAVAAYGARAFAPFEAELYLGLRVDGPALAKPELREAIAAALDRKAIVRAVYPDEAWLLDGIVPSPLEAAGGDADDPGVPAHDARHARDLVREAYPGGHVPTISLDHDSSTATAALMAIVARSLHDVGIPTKLNPLSLEAYQQLLVSGRQQVFTLSWLGGYASAGAYLDPLLRSSSPDNLLGLRDPSIDAALDAARSAPDPSVAAQHWRDVERSVLSSAIVIPIAQFRTQVVVADGVLHLRHALDGSVDWSAVQRAA